MGKGNIFVMLQNQNLNIYNLSEFKKKTKSTSWKGLETKIGREIGFEPFFSFPYIYLKKKFIYILSFLALMKSSENMLNVIVVRRFY